MSEMTLDIIAAKLEGLEETIIYKLMDRAQFSRNRAVYEKGNSGFSGDTQGLSLFDLRLLYHEEMDAKFGRFLVPEERPFYSELPKSSRDSISSTDTYLNIDDYNTINLGEDIKKVYLEILESLCINGDDGQYGSSVEHDVYALQALSRRIHFGSLYVAESKYRSNPSEYDKLIDREDEDGLMNLLTREVVEEKILLRVKEKVVHIQANINDKVRRRIDPEMVLDFYRKHIIPLTKKGEILYLLNRKRDL